MAAISSMAVPRAAKSADKLPSGSWSFGPITISWSIKDNDGKGEVDVDVSVFGFDIDTLTGTLTSDDASLEDDLNILDIIKGFLKLEAKWNQGPAVDGLWISGQLKGPGFDTGVLNHRIIAW